MWWNRSYPFRRGLSIDADEVVPAGHPVMLTLSSTILENNKAREDLLDVEVLFFDGVNWHVLPRRVTSDMTGIHVTFDLHEDFDPDFEGEVFYYVYYGNPDLANAPSATAYVWEQYPIANSFDGGRISYTRPGDDWMQGTSYVGGARATLRFRGVAVRVISNTSPTMGKLEVRIDDGAWEVVDLFSGQPEYGVTIYETELNYAGAREIQMRAQTDGKPVNIASVDYRQYIVVVGTHEEVDDLLAWSTFAGGV